MDSFEDFLNSLSKNEIVEEFAIIQPPELIEADLSSIGKLIETVYYRAVDTAIGAVLFYLRKYHEWNQQL